MHNKKHTILGILALLLVFGTAIPGEAAKDDKKPEPNPKAPITVEADRLTLNDITGDVFAQGNVSLVQNDSKVLTELLQGNTKSTRVWADGKATLLQPKVKMEGEHLDYNYTTHDGTMEKADGKVDKDFVKGQQITVMPQEMIINNGQLTSCPAEKITCYHIEADKIEIWPGDKLIAYNARFYIRDKHIFTLARYQTSLNKDKKDDVFPSIGYNNDDGLRISQNLQYAFSDKVIGNVNLRYYSKRGFKPIYNVTDSEKNYSLQLVEGEYENSDNEWVKKKPEFSFSSRPYRVGSFVSMTAFGSIGQWKAGNVSGSRQEYGVYFARDPIQLNKMWQFNVGTGYNAIHYGYNNSDNNIWHLNMGINGRLTERLNVWTNYYYSDESGRSVYAYDTIDNARELDNGFSYRLDRKNNVSVNTIYNLDTSRLEDVDYTLNHDLHCWLATLTYRAKRSEWKVDLSITRW